MKFTYKTTMLTCFSGFVAQAIIVNFTPLLFVTFQNSYHIPLSQITLLVTISFVVQLLADFSSIFFVDRIGYRTSVVLSQACAALGLILLTVLPEVMPPFAGILTAVIIYSAGGGLMEVVLNPIMEGCPTDNKETAMSVLHSFYCWGYVGVVLLSTVYFAFFGTQSWKLLSCLWAIVPITNALLFLKTPIGSSGTEGGKGLSVKELCKNKIFWMFVLVMICSGASEQGVGQWTSAFAEKGLGVSKTVGDLAGTMTFAILMGVARSFYGKFGDRINIERFMTGCTLLCLVAYLIIALSPIPVLSLIGCAICGFSVGIMWPGNISRATAAMPMGGTAMFALLALAGDIGCTAGPTVVGFVSDALNGNMQMGILAAIVFPIILLLCLWHRKKQTK